MPHPQTDNPHFPRHLFPEHVLHVTDTEYQLQNNGMLIIGVMIAAYLASRR